MSRNKLNLIGRLQDYMDSPSGKTLLNYLYSWGASIVILGALFKLTHIAGANLMLFIGMGTEVIVFFFSAFERNYEISEDKEESPAKAESEVPYEGQAEGAPVVMGGGAQGPIFIGGGSMPAGDAVQGPIFAGGGGAAGGGSQGPIIIGGGSVGGGAQGPIIIGGGSSVGSGNAPVADGEATARGGEGIQGPVVIGGGGGGFVGTTGDGTPFIPEVEQATQDYIDKIRELTDALQRVTDQSSALERNMEEMELLGRNLTGINTIYEMQLRGVSAQVGNIDQVNEQTRKMALQVEELNKVYARMLEAMTVNMKQQNL